MIRSLWRLLTVGVRLGWYLHLGDLDGTTHLRRAKADRCADAIGRQTARRISRSLARP